MYDPNTHILIEDSLIMNFKACKQWFTPVLEKHVLIIAFLMPWGHLIAIKWHNLQFGMERWEYFSYK